MPLPMQIQFLREAVIIWKRLSYSLNQNEQERSKVKRGWQEHITLVSLLSRSLADWGGWIFFYFLSVRTLHSPWHLLDAIKQKNNNPADVTSEVKIIVVITAIAPNVSIDTGAVRNAFHKYIYSTNPTRQSLSNSLHSGEPEAYRVRVWFCAKILKAGNWQSWD